MITQEQSTEPWEEGNTNTINTTKCPPMQDADTAHLLKLVSIQDNEAIFVIVGKPPDNFTLGLRFVVYHDGKLCKRRWCNNRKEVRVGLTIQWTWQIKPTVRCIGRLTYVVEEGLSRRRGCFLLLRRRCLLHRCWFRFCWIIIIVARFVSSFLSEGCSLAGGLLSSPESSQLSLLGGMLALKIADGHWKNTCHSLENTGHSRKLGNLPAEECIRRVPQPSNGVLPQSDEMKQKSASQ